MCRRRHCLTRETLSHPADSLSGQADNVWLGRQCLTRHQYMGRQCLTRHTTSLTVLLYLCKCLKKYSCNIYGVKKIKYVRGENKHVINNYPPLKKIY